MKITKITKIVLLLCKNSINCPIEKHTFFQQKTHIDDKQHYDSLASEDYKGIMVRINADQYGKWLFQCYFPEVCWGFLVPMVGATLIQCSLCIYYSFINLLCLLFIYLFMCLLFIYLFKVIICLFMHIYHSFIFSLS